MNNSVFYFFNQLASTNQWALRQQRAMPFFCVAQEQHLGRGRRANQWHSHRGDLLLSYATVLPSVPNFLSVLLGLRLAQFFMALGINMKVKWPNDLILFTAEDKPIKSELSQSKVGGILIETRAFQDKTKVVCGVGLNLSPKHQKQAVIPVSAISYKEALLGVSEIIADTVKQAFSPIDLLQWQKHDCLFNQAISFEVIQKLPGVSPMSESNEDGHTRQSTFYRYAMLAQGINEQGELLVYDKKTEYHTSLNNAFNIRRCLQKRQ